MKNPLKGRVIYEIYCYCYYDKNDGDFARNAQNQVVEQLRNYIANLQDDLQWDILFQNSQIQLAKSAQYARKEIAKGNAESMDYDQL